jgi:endonuclease G
MDQLEAIKRTTPNFDKLLEEAMATLRQSDPTLGSGVATEAMERMVSPGRARAAASPESIDVTMKAEAIVVGVTRPVWFIRADKIEINAKFPEHAAVAKNRAAMEKAALSVGRVDLVFHPEFDYGGTGWLVAKDIAVTNRHVAEMFAAIDRAGGYDFLIGKDDNPMEARLNFRRQLDDKASTKARRALVSEVLHISAEPGPDFAFLRVQPVTDSAPLDFEAKRPKDGRLVAAIGYPAWDGERNDAKLMDQMFDGIYNVKRFSPGFVTGFRDDDMVLLTDYTTLGGNSGSAVVDVETGKAVGLHFAGAYKQTNVAVPADILAAALRRLKTSVGVEKPKAKPKKEKASDPAVFKGRDGYTADFLGSTKALRVEMPGPGKWAKDIAPVTGNKAKILTYRHFSVVQCASRRLPLFTAVNINGEQQFVLKREGDWLLDGRIKPEHQMGNDIYASNPLDRGHMVRRRDPGWGSQQAEAEEGEADTFHYTNSAPQHEDLNQKTWVGLEDYILEAAETQGFKVTVFTGPVFRDTDRKLKKGAGKGFPIPAEFWKVAVMVNADTGKLSATGYILSQGEMIKNLTEAAFVYGKYDVYQVRIALIEAETGLDFRGLPKFDPLGSKLEAAFGKVAQRVEGPEDLTL